MFNIQGVGENRARGGKVKGNCLLKEMSKESCLTIRKRPKGEIDQLSLQTANRPCFIRAIQLLNDIKVVISALSSLIE